MSGRIQKTVLAAITGGLMIAMTSNSVLAYSCEVEFQKAMSLVKQAKALVKKDTDSRILAMIQEAEGIAHAGIVSHRRAGQRHVHEVGKFKHSDAVRKGRWAQQLAKQALFLLDGTPR